MVPGRGLEPPWDCSRQLLRLVRLPFRHPGAPGVYRLFCAGHAIERIRDFGYTTKIEPTFIPPSLERATTHILRRRRADGAWNIGAARVQSRFGSRSEEARERTREQSERCRKSGARSSCSRHARNSATPSPTHRHSAASAPSLAKTNNGLVGAEQSQSGSSRRAAAAALWYPAPPFCRAKNRSSINISGSTATLVTFALSFQNSTDATRASGTHRPRKAADWAASARSAARSRPLRSRNT